MGATMSVLRYYKFKELHMNETQLLLEQIAKHWGWEVGNKVKQEIATVVGASDIDMTQLQSAIATIQGILDADTSTGEFDVGANIVTQLTDHLARIVGLENGIATLNGSDATVGSVAYAVKVERERAEAVEATQQSNIDGVSADVATLNGDDTVAGSVAKAVKDGVDAEATARANADTALQDQIDVITGGGTGSVAGLQSEVDATQTGAGLEDDGTYVANTGTNYIDTATSLKDADEKLDSAIKAVDDARIADKTAVATASANADAKADANETAINVLNGDATVEGSVDKKIADAVAVETSRASTAESVAKSEAITASNTYADDTFVTKSQIASISAETLAGIFRQALDCGFSGATKQDVLDGTGDCADAGAGGGDGAVI